MTRKVVLSATRNLRENSAFRTLVYEDISFLVEKMSLVCTHGTLDQVLRIAGETTHKHLGQVKNWKGISLATLDELQDWKKLLEANIEDKGPGILGMIRVTNDVILGEADVVIHLTDSFDKADTVALRRVSTWRTDVILAPTIQTAQAFVRVWREQVTRDASVQLFATKAPPRRKPGVLEPGCDCLGILADNGRIEEICDIVVDNAEQLEAFDVILATEDLGDRLRERLSRQPGGEAIQKRLQLCLPGGEGGDVQIASAVVEGLCDTVIFLASPRKDPEVDCDERLFHPGLLREVEVVLARDTAAAKLAIKSKVLERAGRSSEERAQRFAELLLAFVRSLDKVGQGDQGVEERVIREARSILEVQADEDRSVLGRRVVELESTDENTVDESRVRKFITEKLPEMAAGVAIKELIKDALSFLYQP